MSDMTESDLLAAKYRRGQMTTTTYSNGPLYDAIVRGDVRWKPGMYIGGTKWCIGVSTRGWPIYRDGSGQLIEMVAVIMDPHPGTNGMLLEQVRQKYGDPHIRTRWSVSRNCWQVWHDNENRKILIAQGDTEGQAIINALIAATEGGN